MASVPQPQDDAVTHFASRTYAEFCVRNHIHCVPVDETEEQRQDELNRILRELLGRTVLTPFPPEDDDEPTVLDCGFGKGAWIDDLLGQYDDVEVTAVDVFLGRGNSDDEAEDDDEDEAGIEEFIKKRWNLNAPFRNDRSDTKLRPESFDLINSRLLADGINRSRWDSYIRDLKSLLKPGGWLQMLELHLLFQSDSGRDAPFLQRWWEWYSSSMHTMDKDARIGTRLRNLMTAAGFEQVLQASVQLPIGPWKPGQAALGNDAMRLFDSLLSSLSLWPFVRVSSMPVQQYADLIRGAHAELTNPELRLYINVNVAWGQRPPRRR